MIKNSYKYIIKNINNKHFVEGKYPIIRFNNVYLPQGAIFIDYCASSNIFENIDETLSKWFWNFTNCVGVNCSEDSNLVVINANKLKYLLKENKENVKKNINEKYGKGEDEIIFRWWFETLEIMIETSKYRNVSIWTGVPNILVNS